MLGEINKDFYCTDNFVCTSGDRPNVCFHYTSLCDRCPNCRHKHPTPSEYKEEYGEEYPDDGAVYFQLEGLTGWGTTEKSNIKDGKYFYWKEYKAVTNLVCACTPFGKPDNSWRPE